MAKQKQTKPQKYAPRQTRKFQLRLDHEQDQHVQEILDYAKTKRKEVTLIRNGVALYWALENGNIDALFEAFPQYKAQFAPGTVEALEQFMQILKQQQPAAIGAGQIQSLTYDIPKPLPAPPVAEIRQAIAVSADTIADNFLSMFQ
ncbi:MAG: hypothetical protein H0X30_03850 [Anaerolineae bacterium]|nr:hypothetical protein [Anaerolineae bacterium]